MSWIACQLTRRARSSACAGSHGHRDRSQARPGGAGSQRQPPSRPRPALAPCGSGPVRGRADSRAGTGFAATMRQAGATAAPRIATGFIKSFTTPG